MLFPLCKGFSSTGLFQKGGEHHDRPLRRVWSIDYTGSAERVKDIHQLIQDKKPYKCHEMLAKRRAMEGKRQDQQRMSAHKLHLGEMKAKIEAEAEERRQEMVRGIKAFSERRKASDTDIKEKMKEQADEHQRFLKDMSQRVESMPPIMGADPPRETAERTQARKEARQGVSESAMQYKQELAKLKDSLDNRPDMEWTYKPRPGQDSIIRQRKAEGLRKMAEHKEEYEEFLEQMDKRDQERVFEERKQRKKEMREAENRLADTKTQLLQSLNSTHGAKKAELHDIVARVNNRPSGRPALYDYESGQHVANPAFAGYCSPGYNPVVRSSQRERDLAADRLDRDSGAGEEGTAKLLVLSVPLAVRNNILRKHPARSFSASSTGAPVEWTDMQWSQRWALITRFAPEPVLAKARRAAGIDAQDLTMLPATDQRTLSPRTLGLAS